MQTQDFCYWFKGFVELTDGQTRPSETQWECIKQHLDLVFNKQTQTMEQISEQLKQQGFDNQPKPRPPSFPHEFIC